MAKLLIDGITSTDATKRLYTLTNRDFAGSSTPMLKASGLGTGDTILLWEEVAGTLSDSGVTLSPSVKERIVNGTGNYAVTAVLATAGPVSVDLTTSNQ